jgi:D-ribose pyranose/furanose isomerase RbsD
MATYLQGVTDYIPQFQPFQPDLNFYGNIMQTKQTQYDTNWKALNKMYGQYYHADLTRDDNIAKKDNYLNQIEFNLQRVSQLDLSLEQNVDQATQIFKPFYEDKGLMKDMAYTKNFMNNVSYGEGLKNAYDQKQRDQYWADGIAELQFKRQEFKEASIEDAMSMESVEYTPYVNTVAKAQEVAKEAGLSIESADLSKDGRWIVKTKNGEQLIEPLQKLFEARLGNDPGIQAVYKTQSYVNRKNYAESTAAQFGGDKNAAEMKYLENSYNMLKAQNVARYQALKAQSVSYDTKIQDIEKQIKDGTASPEAQAALQQYKMNKDINDQVLARAENEQKELSTSQSTETTTTGFINPYGDIKSLRYKVDNGMASILMQKDLDEAANIFAFKDAKSDIDANPYAVLADKHRYSMQEVAARNAGLANAARIRNEGERKNKLDEARIKAGTHYLNEETGEVVPVEALNETFIETNTKGTSTDKLNMKEASRMINKLQTETVAKPYLTSTLALMERLVQQGSMTQEEASKILAYGKNPKISMSKFDAKLNKYGSEWLRAEVGANDLQKIQTRMNTWLGQNGALSGLTDQEYVNYQKASSKFGDYTNYLKADADWRKKTSYEVEKDLRRQGFKYVDYLYDEKGNLRSEDEFYAKIPKKYLDSKRTGRTVVIGSPLTMGTSGSMEAQSGFQREINYDALVKAAGKVYTSGRIKSPIGFSPTLFTKDGSGKFTMGATTTWVNPKAHGSKSSAWMGEVFNDLNKLDWGATDKNRVTFGGISKDNWNKRGELGFKNDVGRALFDAMKAEINNPKNKMGNFRLGVAPIAIGSLNKAAIIIHPDAEWLKSQVKSGKNGTGPGLITAGEYELILKNGISYITNSSDMTNSMYTNSFQSPLASYVDYFKSYTYTDPTNPNYKFTINKNKLGAGDYSVTLGAPIWNPNTKAYEYKKVTDNVTTFGANLEDARDMLINQFSLTKEQNKLLYNGNW